MNRSARILVAAALAASALAACSSGDDTASPSASASASSSSSVKPTADSAAPATEPNRTLACGRYYNGGDSSLGARIATAAPAMEAQDAGTALTDDQVNEIASIDAALVLAIAVAPAPLSDAYTAIHERTAGAVAAAESGGKNAATLDLPKQVAVIDTECAAEGFSAS